MEHVIAVLFGVGFPALTAPKYALRREAILAGDGALRRREYRETIAWLCAMGLASVAFFFATGRDLSALGVAWPRGTMGLLTVAVALAAAAVLWLQVRAVRLDSRTREVTREALEPVREYFPTTAEERRLFQGVSLSAGVGEELFYRGFLLWYIGQWAPVWVAVIVSSVLFGLAHVMHGTQATLRSTLMGFLLAGLYLAGGSLVAPMILHTVVDLTSGEAGALAFAEAAPAGESGESGGGTA